MKTEATGSVLITGGALRIGRALCLAMAAHGWTVRGTRVGVPKWLDHSWSGR